MGSVSLTGGDVESRRKYGDGKPLADDCDGQQPEPGVTDAGGKIEGECDNEEALPFPEFEAKSLLVLRQHVWPRSWCIATITWPYPFR